MTKLFKILERLDWAHLKMTSLSYNASKRGLNKIKRNITAMSRKFIGRIGK
jgi:hypothetical protein